MLLNHLLKLILPVCKYVKFYYVTVVFIELRLYKIALFYVAITISYTFRIIYMIYYDLFRFFILLDVFLFEGETSFV